MNLLKPILVFVAYLFSISTHAQTIKTEETPASKRATEIIALINSYDAGRAEKYIKENFAPQLLKSPGNSMERHRATLAMLYDESRIFTASAIETPKADEALATCKSALTEVWQQLVIAVEPQTPYRVTSFGLRYIPKPASATGNTKKQVRTSPEKELDLYARQLEKAGIFSGDVLIARNGKTIFHKAYGEASKEFRYPNTTATKFGLGSINKMFTATGILQLIEQQKLSFEDSVSRFLPNVLAKNIADKIKIKHLLTHTSGLGDFLFTREMAEKAKENYREIADYLPMLADDTLRFEPGTQWRYSNTGYLVLGAIIQKVSGLSYDEFMLNNVYKPSGMTETLMPELDLVNYGLADSYNKEYFTGVPIFSNTRFVQVVKGTPAGGGYSTATDLLKFTQALMSGKLLRPETVRQMMSAKPDMNSPDYGFGIQIFDSTNVGHTGGGPGTNTLVRIDQGKGLVFIVLGNLNTGSNIVGRKARELYRQP